jgi:imidazolonepropionase-like amidohydrolase
VAESPARWLGLITPGAYANLIAVAGDPLANVNVPKNVAFVMKSGGVFRSTLRPAGD